MVHWLTSSLLQRWMHLSAEGSAGAQQALKNAAIELYGGVRGMADDAVEALLDGKLVPIENPTCAGHDHGHGEGHSCGNHGEGHSCGNHGNGHEHACGGNCGDQ